MKTVVKADAYTIFQRRDERYAIKDASGNAVNGDEKTKILTEHDLIKLSVAAAPVEEPAAQAAEAAATEETVEAEAAAAAAAEEESAGDAAAEE